MKLLAIIANLILPGVGTMLIGRIQLGLAQFALLIVGLALTPFLVGFPIIAVAVFWSILTVVRHTSQTVALPAS